jgi:serine protease Do
MQLKRSTLVLSASGVLACGVAAGWLAPSLLDTNSAHAATSAAATAGSSAGTRLAPIPFGSAPDYRAIVAQNRAAVVGITAEGSQPRERVQQREFGPQESPFGDDPFFRFFRGLPMPHDNTPARALGSGFIVRPDGVILTNAHVVRDAQHVTVKLADHREFRAKVLGLDASSDVAVLKVDAHDLPIVRLADSDQVAVGDYVLAIGAPYGLEESATAGIVSAKGRTLPGDSPVPFLQTDVAVNPGNSGGPLFDAHGAVVGINSQIYSNTGGYQGVSFAIPIDVAEHVEQQILKTGKVAHARLGVYVQPVDQSLASSFKLGAPQGALVSKVEPDSAASRAGVQVGDVILKLNGKEVSDAGSLKYQVDSSQPGETVKLDMWRNGKALTLEAQLQNAASGEELASNGAAEDHAKLGLAVRPLSPEERTQAGVPAGLLVERSSGPAAEAGIEPGDVVLAADGTQLKSVEQLREIASKHKDVIALLIQRGDSRIFVPVQLG